MQQADIYKKIQDGEYFEALLLAEIAYNQNMRDILKIVDYVTILIKLGNLDKATEILKNTKIKPAEDPNIYFLYSNLYSSKGEIEKLKQLNNANPFFSENSQIYDISKFYDLQGEYENSYYQNQLIDILKIFINNYPKYGKLLKKIIIQIKNNSVENGKMILNDFAHDLNDRILGYFLLGELALLDGKLSVARKRYKKILKSFPDKYIIYNRLGDIELSLKNTTKAKEYYYKSIELNPDDFNTTIDLIRTYIAEGNFKKAKKVYLEASLKFDKKKLIPIKRIIENNIETSEKKYVNGLAWYQGGGNVLKIEINSEVGNGNFNVSGNIGFHLMDALKLSFVVSSKCYKRITGKEISKDIFVNIPNTLIYVDGPSIGLAVTIGILAELLKKKIPHEFSFTGEITLNGDILPVGGLNWKLTAAYFENINTVFIPKRNLRDLNEVPENVKANMNINLISNIRDLERYLWKK